MEKEFVPYELALRMKQLGFDEPCFGIYLMKEFRYSSPPMSIKDITDGIDVLAPTFSQAFRWFDKKFNLFGSIQKTSSDGYVYFVTTENGQFDELFETYEEAELACLERLIDMITNKKIFDFVTDL